MKKSSKRTGRPPSEETARDKVLPPIRVTEKELAAYKAKCEREKESLSEVVRRLLNRWVKR